MSISNDPHADYDRWDAKQQKLAERLPRCKRCNFRINQDDAVCINGDWYCDDCLDELRKNIGID